MVPQPDRTKWAEQKEQAKMALWSGLGLSGGGAAAVGAVAVVGVVAGAVGLRTVIFPPAPEPVIATPAPEVTPEVEPEAVPTPAPKAEPEADVPQVAAIPEPEPEPEPEPAPAAPLANVVRIDAFGSALIAGSAPPASTVALAIDGEEVYSTPASRSGEFAALFDIPPSDQGRTLTLTALLADGTRLNAADSILISPFAGHVAPEAPALVAAAPQAPVSETTLAEVAVPAADARPAAPKLLRASAEGIEIVQGAPELTTNIGLDTISYDEIGDVVLAGRANTQGFVRVYLNNQPVKTTQIGLEGTWQTQLPQVDTGIYTLRIDEVSEEGTVVSRLETPFERTAPEIAVAQQAQTSAQVITVQPGFTLWGIAEQMMGEGEQYVQVFNANKELIRDPDLIYPGQVFTMPAE